MEKTSKEIIFYHHRDTENTKIAQRKERTWCMDPHINELTDEVIGASIEGHRKLGPGLLESAYRNAYVVNKCYEEFHLSGNGLFHWSTKEFALNADIARRHYWPHCCG
jgi:hypothetical protein